MKWKIIRTGVVGLSVLILCLAIMFFPLVDSHLPKAEASETCTILWQSSYNTGFTIFPGSIYSFAYPASGTGRSYKAILTSSAGVHEATNIRVTISNQQTGQSTQAVLSFPKDDIGSWYYNASGYFDEGIMITAGDNISITVETLNNSIALLMDNNFGYEFTCTIQGLVNTSPTAMLSAPSPNQSFD